MKNKKILIVIILLIASIIILLFTNKIGVIEKNKNIRERKITEVDETFLIDLSKIKKVEIQYREVTKKTTLNVVKELKNTPLSNKNPGLDSNLENVYLFFLKDKKNNLIYTIQYDGVTGKTFIFDNSSVSKTLYYITNKKFINVLSEEAKNFDNLTN